MAKLKIKNYNVFIVKVLQLLVSFISSYIVLFLLVLAFGKKAINPYEYFEHILLFDAKPVALISTWDASPWLPTLAP